MTLQLPLIGIQYWRAPTPPEDEWAADLDHIRSLGFDAIQLRVQWAWHERVEGQLDFSDLLRLMDMAQQRGLRTVVKLMVENAPYWLFDRYEADRIDPAGRVIPPENRAAFMSGLVLPCFDRPLVRKKTEPFVRGLVEATCGHPSLLFYSLWNELRSRPYGQCACPESRTQFADWLERRFETVEQLNRAIGKDFANFADFRPPVKLSAYGLPLLWRTWAQEALTDQLLWVRQTVREVCADLPVAVHSGMGNMVNDALGDSVDDAANADVVDLFGHSGVFWDGEFVTYNRIAGKATRANPDWRDHQYVLALQDRWTRSVCGERLAANYELYANDYGAFCPDFGAQEMRDFFLTSLAEGIDVLMMWQFKAERIGCESHAVGLIDLDGEPTPRSQAVGELIRFIRDNRELLADYTPAPADVAMIYDNPSDMLSKLEEHGERQSGPGDQYRYKNNLKGWFRLLWDANVTTDVLSSANPLDLSGYRLVILPAMLHVSAAVREAVAAYVARGGRLLVDAGFDTYDEHGIALALSPGEPFAGMLGGLRMRKQLAGRCPCNSAYGELAAGTFIAQLSASSGPWGSCLTDAAAYLPLNPGDARFQHPTADFAPLYRWLAEWADVAATHDGLRVRRGAGGGQKVWFVHNLTETDADFPLPGGRDILGGAGRVAPDGWVVLIE